MMRAAPTFTIILLMSGTAGCIVNQNEADLPIAIPRQFEMVLEGPDRRVIHINLSSVQPILGPDARHLTAYRVELSEGQGVAPTVIYFLDEGMRIVREDSPCRIINRQPDCRYYTANWANFGQPMPYGIGLPLLVGHDDRLAISRGTTDVSIPVEVRQESGMVVITVSQPTPGDRPPLLLESGSYHYSEGEIFPLRIDLQSNGSLPQSYVARKLQVNLDLPSPSGGDGLDGPISGGNVRQGLMFPGEESDDFGEGVAHVEPVRWLLENSASARSSYESGGCLVGYSFIPPSGEPHPTGLATRQLRFEIAIVNASGSGYRWLVERTAVDATPWESYSIIGSEPYHHAVDCTSAANSPWPTLSSTQFISTAEWLNWAQYRLIRFGYELRPSSFVNLPPEVGWDRYGMIYHPGFPTAEGGGASLTVPYRMEANGNTGYLEYVVMSPNDIASLDRSGT